MTVQCSKCRSRVDWPAGVRVTTDSGAPLCVTCGLGIMAANGVKAAAEAVVRRGNAAGGGGRFRQEYLDRMWTLREDGYRVHPEAMQEVVEEALREDAYRARLDEVHATNLAIIAEWEAENARLADPEVFAKRIAALEASR